MRLRPLIRADYDAVIRVLDEWWGGRAMTPMLPRLFFTHFADTSRLAEDDVGRLAGFVVGFLSPARPLESYVHFVGVDPQRRGQGIGAALHDAFSTIARDAGCRRVRCVTSPTNTASVAFHRRLGFEVEPGPAELDGVAYTPDYDGPGEDRVLLVREL